jgi:hypothetical protein
VRGWARTQLIKIVSGDVVTFPKRARDAALKAPDGLPEYAERLLQIIEGLTVQIVAADHELEQLTDVRSGFLKRWSSALSSARRRCAKAVST